MVEHLEAEPCGPNRTTRSASSWTSSSSRATEGDGVRLQKVLAQASLGSRRVCDDLIEPPARSASTARSHSKAAGWIPRSTWWRWTARRSACARGLVHLLVNKPAGVITTASDPRGRPTVLDLVPPEPRVFPVGRLDADSEGLLLLTNDGDLAHRLMHPSYGVHKEYLVEVDGVPGRRALRHLREGVELDDGITRPARCAARTSLRITIHEGRNRQIRRTWRPWATRCCASCARGSARWPTATSSRGSGGPSRKRRCAR